MRRALSYICWGIVVLAIVLHFSHLVFGLIFQGSAIDGYVENGHYFLGNHGIMHEVSAPIWHVSNVLGLTFGFTWPTALVFGIFSALLNPKHVEKHQEKQGEDQ